MKKKLAINFLLIFCLFSLSSCGDDLITEAHRRPCLQPPYNSAAVYEPCPAPVTQVEED